MEGGPSSAAAAANREDAVRALAAEWRADAQQQPPGSSSPRPPARPPPRPPSAGAPDGAETPDADDPILGNPELWGPTRDPAPPWRGALPQPAPLALLTDAAGVPAGGAGGLDPTPGDLHKQIAKTATFVGGYGGADPAEVIMAFYKKHKPPLANVAEVAKTLATYQAKASGEGEVWQDMMFAEIAAAEGEDPRVAHAEYLNFQASAALAATRAMAASKGWAVVKGDAMSTSRRMLLAAKMMKTQRDEEGALAPAAAPAPAARSGSGSGSGSEPSSDEEASLQDQLDDALDDGFADAAAIRKLLAAARTAGHKHPSVLSLAHKLERISEQEQEQATKYRALQEAAAAAAEKEAQLEAALQAAAEELAQSRDDAEQATAARAAALESEAEAKAEAARLARVVSEAQLPEHEDGQFQAQLVAAAEREAGLRLELDATAAELQAVRVAGGGDSGRPRSPEVFMGAKDLEKAVTEHVDAEAEEFLEEGWDEARAVRSPPIYSAAHTML